MTPNPESASVVHEPAQPPATQDEPSVVPTDEPVADAVVEEELTPVQEASVMSDEEELQSDLASIREELQRRRDNPEQ